MRKPIPYGTACQRERDVAQMRTMPSRWCLYGFLGTLSHEFDAGGPMDAPEVMPAGSMSSELARSGPWHLDNGRGRAIPWSTEVRRDA